MCFGRGCFLSGLIGAHHDIVDVKSGACTHPIGDESKLDPDWASSIGTSQANAPCSPALSATCLNEYF